jgi:predicted lipoprotein with Yx(FWY)xxD motif
MEIDMRNRWWTAPVAAAAVALLAAACGSSASPGSSGSGGSGGGSSSGGGSGASTTSSTASAAGIKTESTSKGTVLTTAKGHTIYSFAIDTPAKSNCNTACLKYWPPVTGKPSMASGASLSGKFGTITTAGKLQATYMGHPLYVYAGDTAAGQVNGNKLNINGGLWFAMTPSAAKLTAAPKPAKSSSGGGGGGYGY